jgi:hypothetical protein
MTLRRVDWEDRKPAKSMLCLMALYVLLTDVVNSLMLLPLLHTVKVKSGESCAKCKYLWKESLKSDGHQFHQYHKKKSHNLDFQRHVQVSIFVFSQLRWEVIVCFVDIGGFIDHHCLELLFVFFLFFFCGIDEIDDHHCLSFLFINIYILRKTHHFLL